MISTTEPSLSKPCRFFLLHNQADEKVFLLRFIENQEAAKFSCNWMMNAFSGNYWSLKENLKWIRNINSLTKPLCSWCNWVKGISVHFRLYTLVVRRFGSSAKLAMFLWHTGEQSETFHKFQNLRQIRNNFVLRWCKCQTFWPQFLSMSINQ